WVAFGLKLKENPEVLADFERSKSVIAEFTSRRTRAELFREALERRVLIAPVYELGDVLELEQLESRDFWDRDAEGNRLPGPFVRGGGTPLRRGLTCPELGEHTGGPDWVAEREQRDGTPAEPRRAPAGDGPLADVRVL